MVRQENKEQRRGLLINITGPGKGKTTSALGTCLRALGWNWRVAVIQFIKDGSETGEKRFAKLCGLPFEIHSLGAGFTWRKDGSAAADMQCADNAWRKATEYLRAGQTDLLVLDELNIALNKEYLPLDQALAELQARPAWMHVIITGRNAPPELIAASDLVSEIHAVKHPFNAGIPAQLGIEF